MRYIEDSVICSVDEALPFQVETDASEFAIAATLSQNSRPVAFFSRMLNGSNLRHSSAEKEASAVIEAVRKWKHYLTGHHFTLITDQKSVSYMFNTKHHGKIKNDKIMRWRIELSTFDFNIVSDSDLFIHTKFKHFTDKYKRNGRQRKDHTVISVSCHPTKG